MKRVFLSFTMLLTCGLLLQPAVAAEEQKKPSKMETLTKDLEKETGVFTLYHDDKKLLVHIKTADLGKNYIVVTSIARGVSSGMLLGGMSWGFGDDAVWTFKKVGDSLHVLRKNTRFKAKAGSPEAEAVKLAYSDSVLYALPILTEADGGVLVDMTRIFLSDDQKIGAQHGLRFASDRSTWAKVKAFPKNIELQTASVYIGSREMDTVADSSGTQVNVHYSISRLPENGYKPRVADDRVGYFLTVAKDFNSDADPEHFVRYINRWNLEKADPKAALSPPKKPIVFYMEKTVPIHLRPYVKAGILEWNKAFRKLGFDGAIEVRQQREEDEWDPEDIRYNTFRWITAEAGFAMGPSRVDPFTGEILDADIIFDASFLRYWSMQHENFTPADVARLMGEVPGALPMAAAQGIPQILPSRKQSQLELASQCSYGHGMQQQLGFAAAAFMAQGKTDDKGNLSDEFIYQGLKEVVMHEVGHTLGLRHNFKASGWKSIDQINEMPLDSEEPTVASVMDYTPPNISPKGKKQGPYYTQTIGPYDYWAIEYGYKPEVKDEDLLKVAARGAEDGLDYSTDEDTRSTDSDPLSNRFDLGEDPVAYAERQMKHVNDLMPGILERASKDGEGYQKVRQSFGMLFSEYWRTAAFAARVPGGIYVHRDHKGDKKGRAPFSPVEAEKQRAAMKLLNSTAFATPEYDPKTLNHLASTRWNHWGVTLSSRIDYPIHDYVEMMQTRILDQLLSSLTLARLHDNELKVAADADAYTLAEHMQLLIDGVFTEWQTPKKGEYSARKPYISSFRRILQRNAVKRLASMVTRLGNYPEDARTLSRMHLQQLDEKIVKLLGGNIKLDAYSKAHLLDLHTRIKQVLEAELSLPSVN